MRFLGWLEDEPATDGGFSGNAEAYPRLVGGEATREASGADLETIYAAARARSDRPGSLSATAGAEILAWNLARGADPAIEPAWRSLLRGEGVAIIAGQQPALLGGPLYTIYKLLTAVALAKELERVVGCPAVAVFWVVGDDADFGEVSSAWLPSADGAVRRLRDDQAPPGGTLIGMLPADRQLRVLDAAAATGAGGDARPADWEARARGLLAAAATPGENWSGLLAALVYRLFPGIRCLFVDGAHPAMLREQTPWIRRAARDWPLAELLREGEAEAREAGFAPALDPAVGDRAAFSLAEGRRVTWAGDSAPAASLGPNVSLRPLLQDFLLPNAATVCGPSEIRYRAQLGPLYRHAGIARPALVPRLRAVLIPFGPGSGPPGEIMPPVEAFRDPDAYLARRTVESAPPELLAEADSVRTRTGAELTELASLLAVYDPGLRQLVESAAGKADFQLQRIREAILARARQRLLRADPRLARWREFVRPRDGEQERSLSLLTPFLFAGPAAGAELMEAAHGHLRRWEEHQPGATAVFELPELPGEGRFA